MNNFELKIKLNGVEIELTGEFSNVVVLYERIKEDLFSNNKVLLKNESFRNEKAEAISDEFSESKSEKIGKVVKTITQKKISKPSKVDLDSKFHEQKFYESFEKYSPKSNKDKILISMYLYRNQTGVNDFTPDLVHTLLHTAAVDTPKNLRQMMINYVNQDKMLDRNGEFFILKFSGISEIEKTMTKLEQENQSVTK